MVSVVRVGIDFGREYPIHEPGKMGLDEFEFAGQQLILG
jgi:hypothetical protein